MVNKKSLATFVRTVGNQVIAGFKHFLNNVKVGGDLIISPDSLGSPATNVLTVDGSGVVKTATAFTGISVDSVSKVKHEVKAGVPITKGQAVYVTGADGTNMIVGLASNASEATSTKTMGLSESTLATNGKGNVVTEGLLDGLNTTAATIGDPVWLGTGGNLLYGLANKPYAPAHLVFIGIVTRVNASNGEIFVKVQNGFELNEIHDVDLKTNVPVNGEILGFNGTLWVNKTIAGWLGYTPANASGTTNYVSKFTGTTTLGNSQIFDNGTNVGIGTATPGYKLEVSGTVANLNNLIYSGGSLFLRNPSNTFDWAFYHDSSNNLRIDFNGGSRLTVNSSGNVGIGTTSPSQKLDVSGYITSQRYYPYSSGSTYIAGDTAGLTIEGGGYFYVLPSAGSYFQGIARFRGGISNDTASYLQINGGSSNVTYFNGTVGIGTTTPLLTNAGRGNLTIEGSSQSILTLGVGGAWKSYLYTNGTNTYVASSNDLFFSPGGGFDQMVVTSGGNVGIGTTSPSSLLEIAGASPVLTINRTSGTSSTINFNSSGSNFASIISNPSNGENRFSIGPAAAWGGFHTFYTDTSERMRITAAGNIGIGTTAPGGKLEVNHTGAQGATSLILRTSDFSTANGTIRWQNNVGTNQAGIGSNYTTSDAGALEFLNGNTCNLIIRSSGNVGIGTTSPTDKLHVVGNVNVDVYKVYNGSSNNSAGFELNGSRFNIHGYYGITFNSSSAGIGSQIERMRINPDGNVGIGTTSPSQKLHVVGSRILVQDGSNAGLMINTGGVNRYSVASTSGAFQIFDEVASTNRFYITSAGNVGIGTTSPAQKLEVSGSARVSNTLWVNNSNGTATVNAYSGGQIGTYLAKSSSATANFTTTGVSYPRGLGFGAIIGQGNTTDIPVNNSSWNGGYGGNIGFWSDVHYGVEGGTNSIGFNAVIKGSGNSNSYGFFSDLSGVTDGVRYGIYTKGEQQNYFSGNVGIGTTSPATKLHVNDGFIRVQGSGVDQYFFEGVRTGGATTLRIYDNSSIPFYDSYSSMYFRANQNGGSGGIIGLFGGNVGINTSSPATRLHVDASGHAMVVSNDAGNRRIYFGTGGTGEPDIQATLSNGTARQLSINAAGGNVGIGTTAPTYKFNVVSNAVAGKQNLAAIDRTAQNFVTFTNPQYSTDASMGLLLRVFPQSDARQGAGIIASGGANNATTDIDLFVTTSPDGLGGTSYSAVKINGLNGNVGIGTTAPGEKLHVVGNIVVPNNNSLFLRDTANSNGFQIRNTSANVALIFQANNNALRYRAGFSSNAANAHIFAVGADTEIVRFTNDGNVGIGTTSPAYKLDVTGVGNFSNGFGAPFSETAYRLKFYDNGGTHNDVGIGLDGTAGGGEVMWFNALGGFYFGLGTNGTKVTISNTGNVGIGTTSPAAKLHVIGNATVSATLSTAHAKITGTIADSFGLVGTAGQILSSTGTGIEWITGGGGGGGTTITVKDEGTTVSSAISTLDFYGDNVQATASGSTATISIRNNAGTGSQYLNDLVTPYVIPGSYVDTVNINGVDIIVPAPGESKSSETLTAILTFGISNVTGSDRFNAFYFRLYNNTTAAEISDTQHRWSGYMSVDEPTTIATFHIPIKLNEISTGDDIYVQCQTSVLDAPEIYYCALTFIKGSN